MEVELIKDILCLYRNCIDDISIMDIYRLPTYWVSDSTGGECPGLMYGGGQNVRTILELFIRPS